MVESRGVAPRPKVPRHPSPQAKPGPKPGSSPGAAEVAAINKPYADVEIYATIRRDELAKLSAILAGFVKLRSIYNTRAYIRMEITTSRGVAAIEFWPEDEEVI